MADARRPTSHHPARRSPSPIRRQAREDICARRASPRPRRPSSGDGHRRQPSAPFRHRAAAVNMDADGYTLVQSRRRWRRRAQERPHRPRPVPPEFVGKCFNCLSGNHVHAECTFPSCCYYCHISRHRARNCKRERPASGNLNPGRREPPRRRLRRPDGYVSSAGTVSGRSSSTGCDTSVLPVCSPEFGSPRTTKARRAESSTPLQAASPAPSRSPSPPPRRDLSPQPPSPSPPPPPPPGHVSLRPRSEIIIFPQSAELDAAEEALSSLALVALVGGNRLPVSPAQVREHLQSFFRLPPEAFTVSRYAPEDFLVRFYSRNDLKGVLNGPVPSGLRSTCCGGDGSPVHGVRGIAEIIHPDLPMLRYRARIRIIQVQDWTTPPTSSGDEGPDDDSDDSNNPDWHFTGGDRSRPWPRNHRFDGEAGGGPPRYLESNLWKERNKRTFDSVSRTPIQLFQLIMEDANVWVGAGFSSLSSLLSLSP
ncbi:unnamed protein product [Miscanthus lutarioriparius]|uniref:Uncharacterized protein n=1 Tax=Miscanthus lutarioriparius TaxID=422564 RepID=A0A811MK84_9POAL|nr:unnamed protein product [Miscanthus lutarioriparius]